VWVPGV